MNNDYLIDYIRLISYLTVILVSVFEYKYKRFVSKYVLLGNIFMASTLTFVLVYFRIFTNANTMIDVSSFLTPAAAIWALLNFVSLMKF